MKKIYILALALIVSTGLATQAYANSDREDGDREGSNKIEIKNEIRGELKDGNNSIMGLDMQGKWGMGDHKPRVFGTVTAVSGNTITITSKGFGMMNKGVATVYTIDATNAKIEKAGVAGTIASILVGDTISVEGTVNGTAIVATEIKDGKRDDKNPDSMPQGNGQPIVGGTVTAINGSVVTVTNKSNVAYSVDMTNAKIAKNGKTAVLGDIVVGDTVLAQGTINGTSVVAVSVIDQGVSNNPNGDNGKHKGFFRRMGGWFAHLFGF